MKEDARSKFSIVTVSVKSMINISIFEKKS